MTITGLLARFNEERDRSATKATEAKDLWSQGFWAGRHVQDTVVILALEGLREDGGE